MEVKAQVSSAATPAAATLTQSKGQEPGVGATEVDGDRGAATREAATSSGDDHDKKNASVAAPTVVGEERTTAANDASSNGPGTPGVEDGQSALSGLPPVEGAVPAEAIAEAVDTGTTSGSEAAARARAAALGNGHDAETNPPTISVEDLPATIRKRMDEVLHEVDDASMREDSRLINFLGEVAEAQALAALNEYHSAVSETSVTIRNKPAYLMGILRKYKQGQRAPVGNGAAGGMATNVNAMGRSGAGTSGLTPSIEARLEKLYASDFIKKDDVDQRCLDFFRDLSEKEAEAAMDEFSHSDIVSIRNKSAFLMSILRKHHDARKKMGNAGMYGPAAYPQTPLVGYGYMDPTMVGQHAFADFYGGAYARPPLFNHYGQPMATFIPPHMPMCPPGNMEILPASIQLRLDHLAAIGFCAPSDIDDRCRKFLREVPEPVALQAIDEFQSVDRNYIRKVSAYFMGVIRKHADQHKAGIVDPLKPPSGVPGLYEAGMKRIREYNEPGINKMPRSSSIEEVLERLRPAPIRVQTGVRDLLTKGIAHEWDMDIRVTNTLLQLTEEQGVAAIEEFASCDMTRIRNKSAYLMGLLKRYRSGAPPPPGLARRES